MSMFLSYILLGLSLAAPIGPINAAQLDKGIRGGFVPAWLVGVGAMAADALYMLLVYFGVVHFINTPFMQTFLWLFGAFLLIYTGVESLKGITVKHETRSFKEEEPAIKSFMSGFLLSLSNPLTILFWLGIYGSVLAQTARSHSPVELLLYSLAIILGISIWDVTMAVIASGAARFATTGFLKTVTLVSGLSLIGFGLYFAVQAFRILL